MGGETEKGFVCVRERWRCEVGARAYSYILRRSSEGRSQRRKKGWGGWMGGGWGFVLMFCGSAGGNVATISFPSMVVAKEMEFQVAMSSGFCLLLDNCFLSLFDIDLI